MLSGDIRVPEHSLIQIATAFPCSDSLWLATTAQAWAQLMTTTDTTEVRVSAWLSDLLKGKSVGQLHRPLQLKSAMTLLQLHIRCRKLGMLDDEWQPDPQSVPCFPITAHWHRRLTPARRIGTALAYLAQYFSAKSLLCLADTTSEFFLWNMLCMSCSTNIAHIYNAAGQNGEESAAEAFRHLLLNWTGTIEARRTVLHAAQVVRYAKDLSLLQASGPWTLPMFLGPFQAALTICIYSILLPWSKQSDLTEPTYDLTGSVDWERLGRLGIGGSAEPQDDPACRWILYGRQSTFFHNSQHTDKIFALYDRWTN